MRHNEYTHSMMPVCYHYGNIVTGISLTSVLSVFIIQPVCFQLNTVVISY